MERLDRLVSMCPESRMVMDSLLDERDAAAIWDPSPEAGRPA
eukprot:CAMPEP_0175453192 /NCGR_PEP_ID=MMETSP0095-20121207/63813_1 /TAXON_ID=311494 /ORGANISM="Alexandrium monilatum, Strain CCMP3105" /LENGTH=41 /DNA_ID= /DNA_START= /DNA_END= /DNA_ORIENTATION=